MVYNKPHKIRDIMEYCIKNVTLNISSISLWDLRAFCILFIQATSLMSVINIMVFLFVVAMFSSTFFNASFTTFNWTIACFGQITPKVFKAEMK